MPSSSRKPPRRRVKIVCTLGPASRSEERLSALILEGMDVARLNFSHGTHEDHRETFRKVRAASREAGASVAVMQDLQGPKIRLGVVPPEGVVLREGEGLLLYPEGDKPSSLAKNALALPVSHDMAAAISKDLQVGARILFDDGKVAARAVKVSPPEVLCEIEVGGTLTSHKGMNLPGTPLSIPCLTEKDILDLKLGLELGVDAIALSFVRSAKDLAQFREIVRKTSTHRPLAVSKIEREEAIEDKDAILDASDAILIARGDMAVELGAERVPIIQKDLIQSCAYLGVPVITATQMLESMVSCPTPTRAEANDVANAVFDGTDAVMLSAETASGKYPLEAVRTMARVIREAERATSRFSVHPAVQPLPGSIVDSIEFSASRIATHVGAVAIVCITHSGMAARTLAKYRPETPIIALMDHEESIRRLSFTWGVQGVQIPGIVPTDDLFQIIERVVKEQGIARDADLLVVTAGVPTLGRGTTNMVKVHRVGASSDRRARSSE